LFGEESTPEIMPTEINLIGNTEKHLNTTSNISFYIRLINIGTTVLVYYTTAKLSNHNII